MRPLRIIALISAAAVIALPVYLLFVVRPAFTRLVEENAREESVRAASHLASMLISSETVLQRGALPGSFAAEAEAVRKDFKVMKIKVYSPSGEVIYSTDSGDIGRMDTGDYFRDEVAGGRVFSAVVRREAKTLEGEISRRDVAETYVPVIRGGRFAGAFEIYYDISDRIDNLTRVMTREYGFLFVIVVCLGGAVAVGLRSAGRSLAERDHARMEWEQTFDAVTDPIMLLDPQFRMTRLNRAMSDFLKMAPDAAIGKTCYSQVHCTDQPIAGCPYRLLLEDGQVHTREIYEERLGRHYAVSVFPILDNAGRIKAVVHYAKDITKRKAAEAALQEREKLLQTIIDTEPECVKLLSRDGSLLMMNPAGLAMIQADSLDQVKGKNISAVVSPEYRDSFQNLSREVFEGKEGTLEFQMTGLKGRELWMDAHAVPLRNERDEIIALLAITRDVTERRKAREAVEKTAHALAEAQRLAHLGSWELDLPGNSLKWSEEIYRIFETDPSAFGASYGAFLDLVHPEDRSLVNEAYTNSVKNRTPYEIVHRLLMKDGRIKHVQERCGTEYDADGRPIRSYGTIQDISERKHAEDMLEKQLKNMTALNDIGIAINSSLDIRVTLNMLLERLLSQLGIDAADVLLLDNNALYLKWAASLGFRTPGIRMSSVRMGRGHAGRAAYERRIKIIHDLGDTLTKALSDEHFKAYVAVPLVSQGRVKGVLELFHRAELETTAEWLGFLETMAAQAAIAIDNATMFENLQRTNMELTLSYDATLEGWGRTLELRDEDTKGHTERVADMTVRFARLLSVDDHEIVHIRRGALLHDIGKIGIPDAILMKPGPLTPEEREIMQLHPEYAFHLLSAIPFLRRALDIPYCHHEKWDGTGYPRGLKGDEIPFPARIFSVVDVADALLSARPYRPAWPMEKVREYISARSGTEFDPALVEVFLKMLEEEAVRF